MKFLVLILAIVATVVWYSRIQKDLTTWRTSVQTLASASEGSQGVPPEPENVANLITLLEHKPYRVKLLPEEQELLDKARAGTLAPTPPPARPTAAAPRPAAPPVNTDPSRTPTPQEAAAEIARKYGSKR